MPIDYAAYDIDFRKGQCNVFPLCGFQVFDSFCGTLMADRDLLVGSCAIRYMGGSQRPGPYSLADSLRVAKNFKD